MSSLEKKPPRSSTKRHDVRRPSCDAPFYFLTTQVSIAVLDSVMFFHHAVSAQPGPDSEAAVNSSPTQSISSELELMNCKMEIQPNHQIEQPTLPLAGSL